MFKKISLCAAMGLIGLGMYAIPAKHGVRTFAQPDGSVISVRLVGDEFFHTFITSDGLAVERKADGCFYYRDAAGVTAVRAHDAAMRTSDELAFINNAGNRLSVTSIAESMKTRTAKRRAASIPSGPKKASQVPSNGSPRVPVLLVQYKDYKFKDADPAATFRSFFTEGATSAHQYFVDQSNGLYTPQFDVYGPVTLSGNRSTYGGNDDYGDDKGVGKMVGEGCLGLDSKIDFSQYDNDGDGECDVVIVLYAGDGEASSYEDDAEDAVWPCQWSLSASDYGKYLTLDGTKVNKFAVFNELNGSNLSKIDGIGTFCHEFSHCLDLPDFYDTNYGNHFGMSKWSLMDYGSYNNDGYTPIGYSAYEKAFMGWIELEEAAENTFYTLPVFNQKNIATDKAVKITNPADRNEYYIIENRANQGWDSYMPAEGLMISHVTYSASAWTGNTVNDYDPQRMTIIPADNSLKINKVNYYGEIYYEIDEADLTGDLWPYGNANELTDTSIPKATVNTGSLMGKPVTEMTRNSDGTISFWTMKAPLPALSAPSIEGHSVESATSVTLHWLPGDTNDATYTIEIKEHRDITYELALSTDFTDKNHGWATTGYTGIEAAENGIRLGSSKQQGSLTSPQFNVGEDGIVTVRLSAKYYNTDLSALKVSLLNASGSAVDSETIDLSASYDEYAILFHGTPGAKASVKIETTVAKKRFYVSKADIYNGDATELLQARALAIENGSETSRIITGISGTSYTIDGLKALGTFDYRIKAVPTDAESFTESPWSEFGSVTLSNASGITDAEVAENAPAEYFTIQGLKVNSSELTPGIYIIRRGTSVSKIVIR